MTIESDDDRGLPAALAALAGIGFPADTGPVDEDGDEDDDTGGARAVDFEPYDEFLDAEDTADWFRSWTGNPEVDGGEYRVFGQDGSGGYAAIWLARDDEPLTAQPVVFFGSGGTTGVVACDLGSFLWLLADGSGPMEAVEFAGRRAPGPPGVPGPGREVRRRRPRGPPAR